MVSAQAQIDHDRFGRFTPGNLIRATSKIYTQSPEEIRETCADYLDYCTIREESPTIPGLCNALGFSNRQALWKFCNESSHIKNTDEEKRTAVVDTLNTVKQVIEALRVQKMVDGKGSTIGAIFDLKCNFGYQETVRVETDNHLHITWGTTQPAESITDIQEESGDTQSYIEG